VSKSIFGGEFYIHVPALILEKSKLERNSAPCDETGYSFTKFGDFLFLNNI
jgi:hypothetical protein